MWLDAYIQSALIRARIAEAQQEAALRRLAEEARTAIRSSPRRSPLRVHRVRDTARLWLKRRIERPVLP